MKAENINTLLEAWKETINQVCNLELKVNGPLYVHDGTVTTNKAIAISIGMTKSIKGDVTFSMEQNTACSIASAMMFGMPVPALDDISISALCELGNMMMGNTASKYASMGIVIDITPPTAFTGDKMSFYNAKTKPVCIPAIIDNIGELEISVSIVD